jgi:triosephosphate isomerase
MPDSPPRRSAGATRALEPPVVGIGMKMYLSFAESLAYLRDLAAARERLRGASLFVLPSFPVLPMARELLAGTGIAYGAQDGHWEERGPHTGSVSPAMLAELGCSLMEVGHAERRRDFAEDDEMTGRKAAAAGRSGLVPVVCVGELEASDDVERVVARQVDVVLSAVGDDSGPLAVAYEPVWAIGADRPAGTEHIARAIAAIRSAGDGRRGPFTVLYGGGVMPEQVGEIMSAGADGVFASRSGLDLGRLEHVVTGITTSG